MKSLKALVVGLFLVCLVAGSVWAQAQDRVLLKQLVQRSDKSSAVFSIAGSSDADTTHNFAPSTFMSIILQAHGDSVHVTATTRVGASDAQMVDDDTWEIDATGTHVQMVYLPTSTSCQVIFSGNANNGSNTTIDSVWAARQW